jgi:hypothetical protein
MLSYLQNIIYTNFGLKSETFTGIGFLRNFKMAQSRRHLRSVEKEHFEELGFTNAASTTQRHSYLQLQRLLENKNILSKADEVIFESEISASTFGIGKSVSDIHIILGVRKIEIETKAGMNFFKGLDEANFMTQSGNSLMTVSKIEDYKVFLNPGLVDGLNKEAAIKKVVDAWSKQSWFRQSAIVDKFKKYGESKGFDFTDYTVQEYLKMNTEWFDEIFIKNISK